MNSQSEFQDGAAGYITIFLQASIVNHDVEANNLNVAYIKKQAQLCAKLIVALAHSTAFEPRVDEETKENARKVLEGAERALQNLRKREVARELAK